MELNEILEAIGFSGDAENLTREKLVGHINANFVKRERAFEDDQVRKQAFGRVFGEIAGKVAPLIGKSKSEIQEMGNEAAFDLLQQTWEAKSSEIEKIKQKAAEGQSKQLADLQAERDDLAKSVKDYQEAVKAAQQAAEEANKKYETGIHEYKIGMAKKDLFGSLPWSENANEFVRKGIEAAFAESYKLDLDGDTPVIKTVDGNLIPDPKKAGSFVDPKTVLTQLAEKAGALKNNNGGGAGEPKPPAKPVAAPSADVPEWLARRQAAQAPTRKQF